MATFQKKIEALMERLNMFDRLIVAFSGGVDSTFLLAMAKYVLGERVVAVTVAGPNFPMEEIRFSEKFCADMEIHHLTINLEKEIMEAIKENKEDRCYICKKTIFSNLKEQMNRNIIEENILDQVPYFEGGENIIKKHIGIVSTMEKSRIKVEEHIVEGSIVDDASDFRPGRRAIKELGIISPLEEAGFTKEDVREGLKTLDIPHWDKPSSACLASRIQTGEEITIEKLKKIEKAESYLRDLGFSQVRVRVHGAIARIEVEEKEMEKFSDLKIRKLIDKEIKKQGFEFVALDLLGYKTGSMNSKNKK